MAEVVLKILGDERDLIRAFRKSSREAQSFQATMVGTGRSLARGLGFTAATAGVVGFGVALRDTVGAAIDFESSFAGVRKTVDATEPQFAALSEGFRNLAREIPVGVDELNRLGEAGGQLGVATESLLGFTRVAADLGATTGLAAEDAATGLARIATVTQLPQQEFRNLGSALVELGNQFASFEGQILDVSSRLAGAGNQIGLSQAEILGFGNALATVFGENTEAAGSAFSRVFADMGKAVASGGKQLDLFAKVAGRSSEEFRNLFSQDAAEAVTQFVEGLGRMTDEGANVFAVLDQLKLGEVRVRDALLRTAGAQDLVRRSVEVSTDAFAENNALTEEAAKRYETTASRLLIFRNRVNDLQITLGEALLPALEGIVEPLSEWLDKTENQERVQRDLRSVVEGVTTVLGTLRSILGPVVEAVGGLENVVKLLVGWFAVTRFARFITGIQQIGTAARLAAGTKGLGPLITKLTTLRGFGALSIPILIKIIDDNTGGRISDFNDWIFQNITRPAGEAIGLTMVVKTEPSGKEAGEEYGRAFLGSATPFLTDLLSDQMVDAWQRNLDALPKLARPKIPLPEFEGGGTAGAAGVTAEQRNAWFDALVGRRLDRTQDIRALEGQLRELGSIAALIQERIAKTKDITRRLNLEDELLDVRRRQRSIREQIASNQQAHREELKAIAEQRRQLQVEARERAALVRETRQFRALGLGAGGAELIPNAQSLRKTLGSVTDAVKGTMLDTTATRNQLARIRKVLSGGFGKIAEDVRGTIDGMLEDITDSLNDFADEGGPETKFRKTSANRLLKGLGLDPDEIRALRGRLSQVGVGGTVPTRQLGAFGMAVPAGAAPPTSFNLYIDGAPVEATVTRRQRTRKRRNPIQKRGPSVTGG
jgi:TP901 family phage tail tape measure protein